jgi:hypothetical protein
MKMLTLPGTNAFPITYPLLMSQKEAAGPGSFCLLRIRVGHISSVRMCQLRK